LGNCGRVSLEAFTHLFLPVDSGLCDPRPPRDDHQSYNDQTATTETTATDALPAPAQCEHPSGRPGWRISVRCRY